MNNFQSYYVTRANFPLIDERQFAYDTCFEESLPIIDEHLEKLYENNRNNYLYDIDRVERVWLQMQNDKRFGHEVPYLEVGYHKPFLAYAYMTQRLKHTNGHFRDFILRNMFNCYFSDRPLRFREYAYSLGIAFGISDKFDLDTYIKYRKNIRYAHNNFMEMPEEMHEHLKTLPRATRERISRAYHDCYYSQNPRPRARANGNQSESEDEDEDSFLMRMAAARAIRNARNCNVSLTRDIVRHHRREFLRVNVDVVGEIAALVYGDGQEHVQYAENPHWINTEFNDVFHAAVRLMLQLTTSPSIYDVPLEYVMPAIADTIEMFLADREVQGVDTRFLSLLCNYFQYILYTEGMIEDQLSLTVVPHLLVQHNISMQQFGDYVAAPIDAPVFVIETIRYVEEDSDDDAVGELSFDDLSSSSDDDDFSDAYISDGDNERLILKARGYNAHGADTKDSWMEAIKQAFGFGAAQPLPEPNEIQEAPNGEKFNPEGKLLVVGYRMPHSHMYCKCEPVPIYRSSSLPNLCDAIDITERIDFEPVPIMTPHTGAKKGKYDPWSDAGELICYGLGAAALMPMFLNWVINHESRTENFAEALIDIGNGVPDDPELEKRIAGKQHFVKQCHRIKRYQSEMIKKWIKLPLSLFGFSTKPKVVQKVHNSIANVVYDLTQAEGLSEENLLKVFAGLCQEHNVTLPRGWLEGSVPAILGLIKQLRLNTKPLVDTFAKS